MKKTNNKILLIAVGLLLAFGIYSCEDKFLDEEENFLIDSESYFNSEDDYYLALVGAYDLLQATYVNNLLGEIASDNTLCGGESATDVVGFQQIDDMIHTSVNSNLRDVWNWMFALALGVSLWSLPSGTYTKRHHRCSHHRQGRRHDAEINTLNARPHSL